MKSSAGSHSDGKLMKLRSRLILAVIAVLAVAFVLGDFGVERHSPPQSTRIASTEKREQITARTSGSVRETTHEMRT
jgi:hypothetical protein